MPTYRLAALAVFLAATTLPAADWPQWRGPNRDGISTETGLLKAWPKGGPPLAWKINLGGYGYASPSIVGDKIYITAAEDHEKGQKEFALCLSAKDGRQIWKTPELPVGDKKYSDYSRGNGPRSSPTVAGEFVYILGAHGDLCCLKAADGSVVWSHNLVKDFGGKLEAWGYSESVLIDGGKLVCTPGGDKGTILALDPKTGKKIWQSEELKDPPGYASIIAADIGGVRQYITQTNKSAVGVRASDGKLLWRVAQLKRGVAVIPTPIVHDGYAFFTSGYGAGCELIKLEPDGDGTKATVVYTNNKLLTNHHGGAIRIGGYVYGHSDSGGRWVCFDDTQGGSDPTSEFKFGKGSVIAADGRLYCYSESKGEVVLVDASPGGWKEMGRFEIPQKSTPRRGGSIWTHPVIANGKLYLRDHELLFCYNIAAK
jgi:outer membrane protein assembly factor BamB